MARRPLFVIQVHEDHQPHQRDLLAFVRPYWVDAIGTPLPDTADAVNDLEATINHSRWVVDCPVVGCGFAMMVSKNAPLFICWECGSLVNGGNWYNVVFPPNAAALEAVLLLRPAIPTRNWIASETLADLKAENEANGIPVR